MADSERADAENWVTLTIADNLPLADLTAARLREAGIPVVLSGGDASSYMGASSPTELKVPEGQLREAQKLLN